RAGRPSPGRARTSGASTGGAGGWPCRTAGSSARTWRAQYDEPGSDQRRSRRRVARPGIARKSTTMGLGNKRGHVHGSKVSGGHTTLIDGADAVVKKLGGLSWFESVRTGVISVATGGHRSVTIRRYAGGTHANTVKLIFRTKRSVQDVYLRVHDMETNLPAVVGDIVRVVGKEWRGAVVYDRTA